MSCNFALFNSNLFLSLSIEIFIGGFNFFSWQLYTTLQYGTMRILPFDCNNSNYVETLWSFLLRFSNMNSSMRGIVGLRAILKQQPVQRWMWCMICPYSA